MALYFAEELIEGVSIALLQALNRLAEPNHIVFTEDADAQKENDALYDVCAITKFEITPSRDDDRCQHVRVAFLIGRKLIQGNAIFTVTALKGSYLIGHFEMIFPRAISNEDATFPNPERIAPGHHYFQMEQASNGDTVCSPIVAEPPPS